MADLSEQQVEKLGFNIKVSIEGDQWCALIGPNLQEGVAGFSHAVREAVFNLLGSKEFHEYLEAHLKTSVTEIPLA